MRRCGWMLALAMVGSAWGQEGARWRAEAARVRIVRDDWGIAHVHGKTDADAVFGMVYAQCEDDFNRVETNYLNSLGRLAEAEGEAKIWQDLRQQLFVDPVVLRAQYAGSPAWLKALMDAWADGWNFFLATHKDVKARVLQRVEPWMALSFTEGSIGGDIERVDLKKLEAFYSATPVARTVSELEHGALSDQGDGEPRGSNGIAIGPANTVGKHALLLINPHTSFFFRSELQMTSDEGLDAYGAVTWGQIFVYQGFNARAGWMHTSSGVDAVDEYLEAVSADGRTYRYGGEVRPVVSRKIVLGYRKADGSRGERTVVARFTSHGPVVREDGGKWVSIQLMNKPVEALEQSFGRTKARTYAEYAKTMELKANSSNNTIFADADGDIAYWHGNFIPKRDVRFDFTKPVDGADPATDWHGLMTVAETPHLLNPASGYLFNVNNAPWAGAGVSSLRKAAFPAYVESGTESARGLHAIRVLDGRKDFTVERLRLAAYDSYLPWFAETLPALFRAWDGVSGGTAYEGVRQQVAVLRGWDDRWGVESVPTSLAVYWGEEVRRQCGAAARTAGLPVEEYVATKAAPEVLLKALAAASDRLVADFGSWQTKWGEINRFQRLTGDIVQPFSDAGASVPVGFTSSLWGSLASFGARPYPGTKKWYGTSGNSFVAIVEFGDKVRARAVTAGGESGHPGSKHFDDEAGRYAVEDLREVYFYPEQLVGHTERVYRPGE